MRTGTWVVLLALLSLLPVERARAQSIDLDIDGLPLEQALVLFSSQAGVDVVYAHRLVATRTAQCRYRGDDAGAALACVLKASGLAYEPLRRRQYVLLDLPAREPATPGPPPSGRALMAGFVADASDGEVLPGAHVYLPSVRLGTTTNEAGYFALPELPLGRHRVRVSYLGYAALDTLLEAGGPMPSLMLQRATVAARGVVVEAARDVRGVTPSVVAVPVRQLEQLPSSVGEPDLFQALQWIPGVRRSGGIGAGMVVRGGAPDQNLYLLDGAPVYHPWHAFSLISTFQTETLKDVRLYRGAFPAEYGGRLASVLDAELRDGSSGETSVQAGLSPVSGRALVEGPLGERTSFMLSGRGSYLDRLIGREHPVVDDAGRHDTLRTGYHFSDFSAKIAHRAGTRGRLSASFYTGRDVLDVRLPFTLSSNPRDWLRPSSLYFEVAQDWGNRVFSLRHQYLYSPSLYVTTTGYYSGYDARESAFLQPAHSAFVETDYDVRVRDLGLKLDVDYYPSLAHRMRLGGEVVGHHFRSALAARVQRAPGLIDVIDDESRSEAFEVAVYVQDTWQPTPRWLIEPGLRMSLFSHGGYLRAMPRLASQFSLVPERVKLRAGLSTQTQYIHQLRDRDAVLYDRVSSRWIPVDTHVRPSYGLQADAGAEATPLPGLTLSAGAYWRRSWQVLLPRDPFATRDELIGPGIDVGTLLASYARGIGQAYGVELEAQLARGPWSVRASYAGGRSFGQTDAVENGRAIPTRYDIPRVFRGIVSRSHRKLDLGLALVARSGDPHTVPVSRYLVGGPLDDPVAYLHRPRINNGRLPAYVRADLTVGYRFAWIGARWHAQVHVYNVANRRNVISRQYDPAAPITRRIDGTSLPLIPLFDLTLAL